VLLKYDETFSKHDTAALAALFTKDGVFVSANDGTFHGRQAIEKYEADNYRRWHPSDLVHAVDQLIAVGNDVRAVGKYGCAVNETDGRSKHIVGHYSWVLVREGDTWKIHKEEIASSNERLNVRNFPFLEVPPRRQYGLGSGCGGDARRTPCRPGFG
jgi:uncharacterized protein (TIGR02246 family)